MSAKNEERKNIYIKLDKLRKNIIFRNFSPNKNDKNELKEMNYNNIFKGRDFNYKTEKIFKGLRKIFSYNLLPEKETYKYKFVKPKSYIENDFWYSYRKDNHNYNNNNYNSNKLFSKSFLTSTCSKNHSNNNIIKLSKFQKSFYSCNSKENKIYKAIVKKSLLRNISAFKKKIKISNHIHKF